MLAPLVSLGWWQLQLWWHSHTHKHSGWQLIDIQYKTEASNLPASSFSASFPPVIVHSSVMTMTPVAESTLLCTLHPWVFRGRKKKGMKRNCEAGRDGRKVCGRKWEKESARQKERQWHFPRALFTSRTGEVKRAAREGCEFEGGTGRRAIQGRWKKKKWRYGGRDKKDKRGRRGGKCLKKGWAFMGDFNEHVGSR